MDKSINQSTKFFSSDKENETETLGNISEEEKQDTEKQEQDLKSTPDDQSDDEVRGQMNSNKINDMKIFFYVKRMVSQNARW